MPFYLAKGLEFDSVFVPGLQDYTLPLHRQALYINATRALHMLRLYGVCLDSAAGYFSRGGESIMDNCSNC